LDSEHSEAAAVLRTTPSALRTGPPKGQLPIFITEKRRTFWNNKVFSKWYTSS